MDARRHRVSVCASKDQYLAVVVLWLLFLTSLLAWPAYLSSAWQVFQLLTLLVICWHFAALLWRLKHWQWQFDLNAAGELLEPDSHSRVCYAWVSPWLCLLLLQQEGGKRRLCWVFADMLADADYRELCRLLLLISARGIKS